MVSEIELRCTDNGIRTHNEDGKLVSRRSAPMEFEARLYTDNDKTKAYFRGTGRSDAEAIGALICRCPEKFKATITIEG